MKTPSPKLGSSGTRRQPLAWEQLLEEADLCATYAQNAANCGRFCAACGLILTANALCIRALESSRAKCELAAVESAIASRLGFYQDEVDKLIDSAVQSQLQKRKLL